MREDVNDEKNFTQNFIYLDDVKSIVVIPSLIEGIKIQITSVCMTNNKEV